jgi:hypothetical protein
MPYEIELPDGRFLEFPDSMTQDQMSSAIQKNFPEFKKETPKPDIDRPIIGGPETPGS